MKTFLKTFGLQKKFMIILLVSTMVLLLIVFFMLDIYMRQSELEDYRQNAQNRLNAAFQLGNREMYSVIDKSESILRNSLIIDGLRKDYTDSMGELLEYYWLMDMYFKSFITYDSYITGQIRIYPANESLPEGKYISSLSRLENKPVWSKLNEHSQSIWEYTDYSGETNQAYISFVQNIDYYGENLGYLEMRIQTRHLIDVLNTAVELDAHEILTLTSSEGQNIYISAGQEEYRTKLNFQEQLLDGSILTLSGNEDEIYKRYYVFRYVFILSYLIVVFGLFFLYRMVISFITKDLYVFVQSIQNNGDLLINSEKIDVGGDSDIVPIKQKFRDLIKRINVMYTEIIEINQKRKELEMELLQTSINPHLLYNSLSVIKWRIIRLKENDLADMIDNMTEYYRKVLSEGRNVITIADEIYLTEQYIKVIEISTSTKYLLEKNVDESVLSSRTIKLILQPIVENAVLHGLNGRENPKIIIDMKRDGNKIQICVADNGYGMSQEDIQKVMNVETKSKQRGYGIKNTISRIKTFYGDECGLSIDSEPGEGTCVNICIKYLERDYQLRGVE